MLFQNVPPDLSICTFVLEQSLSVRALQEMLANTQEKADGVSVGMHTHIREESINKYTVGVVHIRVRSSRADLG